MLEDEACAMAGSFLLTLHKRREGMGTEWALDLRKVFVAMLAFCGSALLAFFHGNRDLTALQDQ